MLAQSVKLLLLGVLAALVSACSTPCDAPGRLCAPISSITSLPQAAPAPPVPAPPPKPAEPPPEPPQTFAVAMPDSATLPPTGAMGESDTAAAVAPASPAIATDTVPNVRIALLLPLHSETLGPAAESLRSGFMAAWERDQSGIHVDVIDTSDAAQDVLVSYAVAQENHDLVVGPLARSGVTAVAASALVHKPTIALNTTEGHDTALPSAMLAMGLSIEEEARQAAQWAATEHPSGSALVVTTDTPWQHRIASAFAAQWQRMGRQVRTVELAAPNGYLSDPDLVQLHTSVQADMPALLFAALGADQTRQLRATLGTDLALYGTSALNPGSGVNFATQELDGVRLIDLPWELQRDHPAVMVYPRPLPSDEHKPGAADMDRLYALGIDAFRVAHEIALHPAGRFHLDGVTGQLNVSFGLGPASFERVEQGAVYKNGVAQPVAP